MIHLRTTDTTVEMAVSTPSLPATDDDGLDGLLAATEILLDKGGRVEASVSGVEWIQILDLDDARGVLRYLLAVERYAADGRVVDEP